MNTKPAAQPAESMTMLQHVTHLLEWARRTNAFIDEHNALPPDGMDRAAREELVASMEELGDLMQRYADSLKSLVGREPSGGNQDAPARGESVGGQGTVLHLASRNHAVPTCSRGGRGYGLRA